MNPKQKKSIYKLINARHSKSSKQTKAITVVDSKPNGFSRLGSRLFAIIEFFNYFRQNQMDYELKTLTTTFTRMSSQLRNINTPLDMTIFVDDDETLPTSFSDYDTFSRYIRTIMISQNSIMEE